MAFKCSKCGACCMNAQLILGYLGDEFPYGFTMEGWCEKYDKEIGCTVYDTRPNVCKVSFVEKKFKEIGMDKETYYKLTAQSCNKMIDDMGLNKSFKLKI